MPALVLLQLQCCCRLHVGTPILTSGVRVVRVRPVVRVLQTALVLL